MTADQLYEEQIKPYPTAERLHIAARIIKDIPPREIIDYSTEWSDEDLRDWSLSGSQYLSTVLGDD